MNKPLLILIIAALKEELKYLKSYVKNSKHVVYKDIQFFSGILSSSKVLIVHSGVGMHKAARATRSALDVARPSYLILTGFCGATQKHLNVGDIVISEKIILRELSPISHGSSEKLIHIARSLQCPLHIGTTVSSQNALATPEEKLKLGIHTGALAINMEGHAVAQVANLAKIPFIEIRSVLDRVNDSLPDFSHDYFSWKKNKYVQRMEIQLKMAHESLTPSLISFIEKTEQEYHLNIQTLPPDFRTSLP